MPMIYRGDCLDGLKQLENNSIDSLITDPPAGISFMGKAWDDDKGGRKQWIAWMSEIMRECMRVMKPGAHGLVWAIPRTSHWTATALEDAGFEIRDVVTHLFGSGFPKSLDISKAIDKAAGAKRDALPDPQAARRNKSPRALAPGEAPRQAIASVTAPATNAAKQWQGWGTALKPASEHWILIRKPISEKTVAKNIEKWGCGGINIDASRISCSGEINPSIAKYQSTPQKGNNGWEHSNRGANFNPESAQLGRFPANLILSHSDHCTDTQCDIECAIKMLDEQSGNLGKSAGGNSKNIANKVYGKYASESDNKPCGFGDSGGASRFFYCAKASKSDKNAGLEGMESKRNNYMMTGSGKISSGMDRFSGSNQNFHPTVKSSKLMSYLIKLITPPQGVVLDPFMGSGSTGVAAIREGLKFVGIEKNIEYVTIATKRIEHETHK